MELATFAALLAAGVWALASGRRLARSDGQRWVVAWWVVVGVLLVVGAMEEVAWGQWLLGFEPPEVVDAVNAKGELTIHNLRGLDGKTESIRVAIGLCGLGALLLPAGRRLGPVRPSPLLLTWFAVITAHAVPDLVADLVAVPALLAIGIDPLAEYVELLIGLAALLYVALATRDVRTTPPEAARR